jgi:hypothetical protein
MPSIADALAQLVEAFAPVAGLLVVEHDIDHAAPAAIFDIHDGDRGGNATSGNRENVGVNRP